MLILQGPRQRGPNVAVADLDRWRQEWFNEAWEHLEKVDRTQADARRLLDAAHAARQVAESHGTPRQRVIGSWQVSRAYALTGESRLALDYAEEAAALARVHHLADLLAPIRGGVARARACAGRCAEDSEPVGPARRAPSDPFLDPEDRAIFEAQLDDPERSMARPT